jgi:hypothetical protein
MKRITQLHENGCGAACVAMIAGVSYPEAVRRIGTRSVTSARQIRAALLSYGIAVVGREPAECSCTSGISDWSRCQQDDIALIV